MSTSLNNNNIFEIIEKSRLTLIGFSCKNERQKDLFVSKLNPFYLDITDMDSSFSLLPHLRESKIDEVISSSDKIKTCVINISNIIIKDHHITGRIKVLRNIFEKLREESIKHNLSVVVENHTYMDVSDDNMVFKGGSSGMYASDLVILFKDDGISVIKNRYSTNFNCSYDQLENILYI